VVSISQGVTQRIEQTNRNREVTPEVFSSLKVVEQGTNEEAYMHVSSADTPQIATLRALDKQIRRAAISHNLVSYTRRFF